jgi:hypothetical protein
VVEGLWDVVLGVIVHKPRVCCAIYETCAGRQGQAVLRGNQLQAIAVRVSENNQYTQQPSFVQSSRKRYWRAVVGGQSMKEIVEQ